MTRFRFHLILFIILTMSWCALAQDQSGSLLENFGLGAQIRAAAFSPDGKYCAGAGSSLVAIFDCKTGEKVKVLTEAHTILALSFSHDGSKIATCIGNVGINGDNIEDSDSGASTIAYEAKVLDINSGQVIQTFKGHTSSLTSVAFSPDNQRLLTGSWDKTARMWDISSGNEIRSFSAATDGITAVAFSPDGKSVLTGSHDNTARLWDAETGNLIKSFVGAGGYVTSIAFSPDGTRILTGSGQNDSNGDWAVRLWDIDTGNELKTFTSSLSSISHVSFSPDGETILWGDRNVHLCESTAYDEKLLISLPDRTLIPWGLSPDGMQVLTSTQEGTLEIRDRFTGLLVRTLSSGSHTAGVYSVSFSPDEKSVLTCSIASPYMANNRAKIWNSSNGTLIRDFTGGDLLQARYRILGRFLSDGTEILTADTGTIYVWDVATGMIRRSMKMTGNWILAFDVSLDSTRFLLGNQIVGDRTVIQLWDLNAGTLMKNLDSLSRPTDGTFPYVHMIFAPNGAIAFVGGPLGAYLVNVNTDDILRTFSGFIGQIETAAFSPDGEHLAIATGNYVAYEGGAYSDSYIHLYDLTDNEVSSFQTGHGKPIAALTFSTDNHYLLSGSGDKSFKLWDVSTESCVRQFVGHTSGVYSLAFSTDGTRILSGAGDCTARLWTSGLGAMANSCEEWWADYH